jgi:hypothetical protein
MRQNPCPAGWRSSGPRPFLVIPIALLFGLVSSMLIVFARADDFSQAYYDVRKDQLVITMIYRGTNPDHTFSLKWGQCQKTPDGNANEIAVEVLDSQWQDDARRDFKKILRFGLTDLQCRPAKVTLRTAPRFTYTIMIPARAVRQPQSSDSSY